VASEFAYKTIRDLSNGLARKDFSPTELLASTLARYEALEPTLNMFAHVDFDLAQKQAEASEARIMQGGKLSELDGIPTSIKDLIAVKGMPIRAGSRATSDAVQTVDAPSVDRLRNAGAVILGKSTTSEFGCKAVGDNQLTGITRNPWNTNMTPGGSSCGAAAMVAAGLVPYALGTDGGGSVRIPAALTGLYGIKANFGRVAIFPTSATPTLAHVGPLAHTAEDAATVLSTIAGYDRRDPFTVVGAQPDFSGAMKSYRNLRIAWSPTLGFGRVEPEVLQITEQAVKHIERLGLKVDLVDTVMSDPIDLWTAEFYAGVGTRLRDFIENKPELLDPPVLDILKKALDQDMKDYYQSVFERYDFREKMRSFFEVYDILLTPTLPVTAFEAGLDVPPGYEDKNIVSWATFTYPFNLTGQPAASIPVGFASNGLPVGLQAISSTHDEISILALSHAYQKSSRYHHETPSAFAL
jgi:aspartyl-tRNA(Asn)/glutamyl-tRNA(Gln) amidotransferase subunit A